MFSITEKKDVASIVNAKRKMNFVNLISLLFEDYQFLMFRDALSLCQLDQPSSYWQQFEKGTILKISFIGFKSLILKHDQLKNDEQIITKMNKRYQVLLGLTAILVIGYLSGPKPRKPIYNEKPSHVPTLKDLEKYIEHIESQQKIKAGNEAEIVWADTKKQQTQYAVVYLHGFSASKNEGNPVHLNLAKKLNANLYLPRLADHGLDTIAPMQYITADKLWESSKEAYAVGKKLGKKVILIGTSTGASLALKLASIYPEIHSLILISPNIAINDKNAWLLNDPWGLQIAKKVVGGDERVVEGKSEEYKKYWYTNYRLESLVELEELIESSMTPTLFRKVKQPVLMLYYYKNELQQDPVVRVDAMLEMFNELGTPVDLKQKVAIPEGGAHVLGSYLTSSDLPGVEKAIDDFVVDKLRIKIK